MLAFRARVVSLEQVGNMTSPKMKVTIRLESDSPFQPIEKAEMLFWYEDAKHLRVSDMIDFTLNLHNPVFDGEEVKA